jgi:hypothetical protein
MLWFGLRRAVASCQYPVPSKTLASWLARFLLAFDWSPFPGFLFRLFAPKSQLARLAKIANLGVPPLPPAYWNHGVRRKFPLDLWV